MFVPTSNALIAGRYELIERIARGGMGEIWRAYQANLGIDCAVKFIHTELAENPELRRRLVREARAAASFNSPHAVNILDVDEWEGCLFIAMELLKGESLEARLIREGRLTPALTLEIVEQVARGLDKAHAARLVHRDLKPENIFLIDDQPLLVKILDFGIAKRSEPTLGGDQTASGTLMGTPGYMSPEQVVGASEVQPSADLWSLGVVAFRCLTGALPFDGPALNQILVEITKGRIPAPSRFYPSLPPSVDEWWFRTMQREPSLRPASATALACDLQQALQGIVSLPASTSRTGFSRRSATAMTLAPPTWRSMPSLMRYLVATVPAFIYAGWAIGNRLWPATPDESLRSLEPQPALSAPASVPRGAPDAASGSAAPVIPRSTPPRRPTLRAPSVPPRPHRHPR